MSKNEDFDEGLACKTARLKSASVPPSLLPGFQENQQTLAKERLAFYRDEKKTTTQLTDTTNITNQILAI